MLWCPICHVSGLCCTAVTMANNICHLAGVSKYNPLAARRSRRRSQVYALMSDTVAFPVYVAAVTMANNICHKYRTKIIHWQLVELELDLKDMLWCPMSRCRFVLPWKLWPLPIIHVTMQEYRNTVYFIGSSSSSNSRRVRALRVVLCWPQLQHIMPSLFVIFIMNLSILD